MLDSYKCVAAYNCISINQNGTLDPCCQYTPDHTQKVYKFTEFAEYQKNIQQAMHDDMIVGRRHARCQKCWKEEDNGWKSLRQWLNEWHGDVANSSVDCNNPIYHLELRLGNFCNLNCFMCFPSNSSSIALERSKYQKEFYALNLSADGGNIPYYWQTTEFDQFSEAVLKDVRSINITGGEPFIIPEVIKLLDRLMPQAKTIKLSFNTNLTKVSEQLIDRLKKFKHLMICISLEGTNEMNDYLRYPSKWNTIKDNIKLLRRYVANAKLSVNHTFQHSSIYSLPALVDFCKDHKLDLQLTTVQGEASLTLNSADPEDLAKFRAWAVDFESLNNNQRNLIINQIDSAKFDQELHNKFYAYVDLLDKIRNTDYRKVFGITNKF